MNFFDIRAAKKAFNEISYNYEKLLNTFEKGKFSIKFDEENNFENLNKFFLILNFSENIANHFPILQFIENFAEIEKIFKLENRNILDLSESLIIKFYNLKEKQIITFLLNKITGLNKEVLLESQIRNFKIYLEKKTKKEESPISFTPVIRLIENEKNSKTNSLFSTKTLMAQSNTNPVSPKTPILVLDTKKKMTPHTTLNFNNKENKNSSNTEFMSSKATKDKKSNYKIVYDQNYSGIKKRNTPDEERKKYVINVSNILNGKDLRTTVMIKNIPTFVNQVELLKVINKNFSTAYNFFYLPIDFNKKLNAGYAFINFRSSKLIVNFVLELENQPWDFPDSGAKVCYLSYARIQGFRSICEHFQKSNIMKQIDEKVKPIIHLD